MTRKVSYTCSDYPIDFGIKKIHSLETNKFQNVARVLDRIFFLVLMGAGLNSKSDYTTICYTLCHCAGKTKR